MLTSIKIEKLFDIFDYDIEFKKEGITILTGPNGYGKTTILKILDALASQNGFFFARLLFKKIVLNFSDNDRITLEKQENNDVLIIASDGSLLTNWNDKSLDKILRRLPFRQIDENRWIDKRSDEIYNKYDLLQRVILEFPELTDDFQSYKFPQFAKIPPIFFISEQRLLLSLVSNTNSKQKKRNFGLRQEIETFKNPVEEYATELRESIKEILAKSSQVNYELDSSFPRRLFSQQESISESDFNQRFEKIKDIQKSLSQYGLSDIEEDNRPTYKHENAKALYVYMNDTEQKLAVFSGLLEKFRTFTDILNEHRFTFKKIVISKEYGFRFITNNKSYFLELSELSLGEQQIVALFYPLLFKVQPGTLVLIDEPELSLHVVWQKLFLDDLFKIMEQQKINIVVATHSPQIINNYWDLTVDLEELRNAETSN